MRAACYEALALYLARHGRALIALWDGKHSDKPGGTYRVVRYACFGKLPGGAPQVESRCEVVYHVLTPRTSGHGMPDEIKTVALPCKSHRVAMDDGDDCCG
jgi:hypothetical protein